MMVGYKKLGGIILGAAALIALLPAAVSAQFIRYSPIFYSLDARGGIALPVGDLGDVADPGVTVGAGFAYFLNPRFALRIDGNVDFLGGTDPGATAASEAPDITSFRYLGGFEVHLTRPSESGAMFTIGASAGGITFNSDQFVVDDVGVDSQGNFIDEAGARTTAAFQDTYFTVAGNVRLGLNASQLVTVFVGGDIQWMFLDENDSFPLARFYGVQPFDSGLLIPIQGGIRINVP